ncbi:MAG: leucine--tRNA ligase [Nanoarchaeota archaeon]|nr:leucine--tRNA ligase [Nanoarchaeota archaeon]
MDDLNKIAHKWQKKWAEKKLFEAKPDKKKEKFFMTVPYPYISGSLHIGHARVVTEADVYTRFQRMLGKNVLYPMAFHISGTPVLGISLAIEARDEKTIKLYKGYVKQYEKDDKKVEKIMKSFQDPKKIVEFFIPKMINEFKTLGLSVDWRRSYTSGDIEHQALVEWQFKEYQKKGYLVQGNYPILFSKTLNNAVGEDDIKEGDTDPVDIQEFTLIKFKIDDSYLMAATLRPETMYGQTNMWIHPDVNYVKAEVDGENWIISQECAEKLKYQNKKVKEIKKINGKDLLGKFCFAPFVERKILILPSVHCDPNIGTGIVTSVPSDAPFDYIALRELQNSEHMCEKYGLNWEEVKKIELIPIIKSKGYGDFPAVEICKKLGIKTLEQHDKIAKATQEIYKVGFHTGIMIDTCGPYKGKKVEDAKEGMKKQLLKEKRADILYETSRPALSRDGGEVIVATLDKQWFLDFNAKGWKPKAMKLLKNLELWPEKYRKQFEDVFDWLDKRPCARKRGLGTKIPFDQEWIIESLSDSTIYMSLYPINHIIRKHKIKKEQLTSEFFNYIFDSKGKPADVEKKTKISKKILEEMNKEWNYWYPFDQRHTFTAHLSNHLSFMIFAHASAFKEKYWPKRVSFHGMVMSEGDKMSKSKGNVITLVDVNEKFGADSFRAFMCNSTSVESSFNWESDKVLIMKKHLVILYETLKKIQSHKGKSDDYKKYTSFVSKTERAIKNAKKSLEEMNLRDYSTLVLYGMHNNYRQLLNKGLSGKELQSINDYVGNKWATMLMPLVPHLAEELWSTDKKNKGFVSTQEWPKHNEKLISEKAEYQDDIVDNLRADIISVLHLAKLKQAKKLELFIPEEWKYAFFKKLKQQMEKTRNIGEIIKACMVKGHEKDVGKMVPMLVKNPSRMPKIVISQKEELKALEESKTFIEKEFKTKVVIIQAEKSKEHKAKQAMPGKPAILVA